MSGLEQDTKALEVPYREWVQTWAFTEHLVEKDSGLRLEGKWRWVSRAAEDQGEGEGDFRGR